MSRDFELLQRIEREGVSARKRANGAEASRRPVVDEVAAHIAEQHPIKARQVTAGLAPTVRNELIKLVQRVFLSALSTNIVMFTGVEAGEGAKWITACIGEILAEARCGSVCLLDADLAAPSLHHHFAIDNQRGLCDMLWRGSSVQQVTQRIGQNLWIVTAGLPQDGDQLTPSTFQSTTVDLLGTCDFLLVSAPEWEHYAAVGSIAAAVQGAILVLDAMHTRRVSAQGAKDALDAANVRVLGSIFNNRTFPIPEFLYSRL
jgi:Mrp family chromosome partitioning ATPase